MVRKPEKPDSKIDHKKTKPKKDRAFLFGSKKWSADEYFGSDEDFQRKPNNNVDGANSNFFDDEDSSTNRRSSARFAAKKPVSKMKSNFVADKDTGVEEEASLPIIAEENKDPSEIPKQLNQDTHETIVEDKSKKQDLRSTHKNGTEPINNEGDERSDKDIKQSHSHYKDESTLPTNKKRRKSHAELFSKLGDVRFDDTELPEEIMSSEATADELAEEYKPKKSQGLFSRLDKDDTTYETINSENTVTENSDIGSLEDSKGTEELKDTVADVQTPDEEKQEVKQRAHRKDHSNLLSRLNEVTFDETEIPEEVLREDETMPQTDKKSEGLFDGLKESEELESDLGNTTQDSSDKTKKSFMSYFLKDEEPVDLDNVQHDETDLQANEEVGEEPQSLDNKVIAEQQEKKPVRRKDHSSLLSRLNEVTFDETEVPEEVLREDNLEEVESPAKPKEPKNIDQGTAETLNFEVNKTTDTSTDNEIKSAKESTDEQHQEAKKVDIVSEEFSSEISLDSEIKEDSKSEVKKKKLGWFRRFFYRDMYDEELIDQDEPIEDEYTKPSKKRKGLAAFFYNDDEELGNYDNVAEEKDILTNQQTDISHKTRRNNTAFNAVQEKADMPSTIKADIKEEDQSTIKQSNIETKKIDKALVEDVLSSEPKHRRPKGKHRNKRVSSKKVEIDELNKSAENDVPVVKPAAASISSIFDEESEPKKRKRKPVGRRDSSFTEVFAAIKNILPRHKSDNKALTFADVNKHNKKMKTKRIFVYAGAGILAVAVALVFILVPLGKPVDMQPGDETMIAISDPVDTDDPTQEPVETPTTNPDPTPDVVQTPIVTTSPDPTHQTINVHEMVMDFKVEADLYYNKVGYSTNYYKYTENEMYILAQLIHGEARGESLDGMVAVGNVVMNRVLNRRVFGNNIKSVVTAAHQFSGYKSSIVPSSKCKIAARKVLDFQVWIVPQNVYYFKSGASAGQDWGSHKYYTKIGGHCFYTHNYGGRSLTGKVPPRMFERTYMWPRMGCKPEDRVHMIQYMLNDLGYDVKADSYFGEGTMEELKKFQQKKGLDADGVAGPTTIEALIRAYGLEKFYSKFYT